MSSGGRKRRNSEDFRTNLKNGPQKVGGCCMLVLAIGCMHSAFD
jgi:hypothetical protein